MKKETRVWRRFWAVLLAVFVTVASVQWPVMTTEAAVPKAKSVKLNYSEYTLKKGKSVRLKATAAPKKASKKIIWKSSKKSVAKVTSKGVVKGLKNGKATITATVEGTKVKATCKMTVGTPVTKVAVAKKSVAMKAGETFRIRTTVKPAKASNKKLTYTSSNTAVAIVSSKGVIRGFRAGRAVITVQAKDGSKKKTKVSVTVTGRVTPVPEPVPTPVPTPDSNVSVQSVSTNVRQAQMKVGQQVLIKAEVLPENATDKSVTWSSENEEIAQVDSKGLVTARALGTTKVKVTTRDGGHTAIVEVAVIATPVTGIKISSREAALKEEETLQLSAEVSPGDATNKKIIWSSRDESVAIVNQEGLVRAVRNGETEIWAVSDENHEYRAVCKITVGIPVTGIILSETEKTLAAGREFTLRAAVLPENAGNKNLVWLSSNTSVASVDNGVVTAVSDGTATITARTASGSVSASCTVTVSTPPTSIRLDAEDISLAVGDAAVLHATVLPENAANKKVAWNSSAEGIASVDTEGNIRALTEGNAVITARTEVGELTASCQVTVGDAEKMVTVESFAELNDVLAAAEAVAVTCNTQESGSFEITQGNYENVALTVNAPNATVTNSAVFRRISIKDISADTWIEKAKGNVLDISAHDSHIVTEGADTRLRLSGEVQRIRIENSGTGQSIRNIVINTPARVELTGVNKAEIIVDSKAIDAKLETSIPVKLNAEQKMVLQVLPGAETSSVTILNETAMPVIEGVGIISVTNQETDEIQDIVAENNGSISIETLGRITGKVQNNSQEPMESVTVAFIPYTASIDPGNLKEAIAQAGEICYTALTDIEGMYTTVQMPYGNYAMIILEEGMEDYFQTVVLNAEVFNSEPVTLSAATSETGGVSGALYDAFDASAVPAGIGLFLRSGANNVAGEILAQTQTDGDGRYVFTGLKPGTYTVQVVDQRQVAEPYIRINFTIVILAGTTVRENMTISKTVGSEQIRFVLTWGAEEENVPEDMDSHLVGPKADGDGKFHVYYSDKSYYEDGTLYADLDVDDTHYEGPETTTIYQRVDGVYHFYVHDFTNQHESSNTQLATSQATVKVYRGLQNIATYHVPNGTGTLWDVCTYETTTSTLTPVNTLSYHLGETDEIGMEPADIARARLAEDIEEYECLEYGETLRNEILVKLQAGRQLLENGTDAEQIFAYMNEMEDYFWDLSQSVRISYFPEGEIKDYSITHQGNYVYDDEEDYRLSGYSKIIIYTKNAVLPKNLEFGLNDEDAKFTVADSDKEEFDKLILVSNSRTKAVEKYYVSCEEYLPSLCPTEVYEEGNIISGWDSDTDTDEEGNEVWILYVNGENETLQHPQFTFEEDSVTGTYVPISGDALYCGRLTVTSGERAVTYMVEYRQYISSFDLDYISEAGNIIFHISNDWYWDEETDENYLIYGIKGHNETLGSKVTCVFDDEERVPDSYSIAPDAPAHGKWNYLLTLQYKGITQTLRIHYLQDTSADFLPNQGYTITGEVYHYLVDEVELAERDGKTWARITGTENEFSNWDQLVLENVDYPNISYELKMEEQIPILTILTGGQAAEQYPVYYEQSIQALGIEIGDGDNHILGCNHIKNWDSQTGMYEYTMEILGENPELKNPVFTFPYVKDIQVSYEPAAGSEKGLGRLYVTYLTQKKVYWITYKQQIRTLWLDSVTASGNTLELIDYRYHYDKDENEYLVFYVQGNQPDLGKEISCTFDAEPESYRVTEEAGEDGMWTHKVTISYKGTTQYLYLRYVHKADI